MSKYTNVKIVHIQYPDEIHRALAVRRQVFVEEQGYSEEIELDGYVITLNIIQILF